MIVTRVIGSGTIADECFQIDDIGAEGAIFKGSKKNKSLEWDRAVLRTFSEVCGLGD